MSAASLLVEIHAGCAIRGLRALDNGALGDELRARRDALGVSLRGLARQCDVSPSYLSDIETGRRVPAPATLDALLGALGCDDRNRWMALAGRLPHDLAAALLRSPQRWADVLALLNGDET